MVAAMADLGAALRPHLDPDPRPAPAPGDRLAAVLALLVGDEPTIVFTERAAALSRHAGEVSFPGGLQDPDDDGLLGTALRETNEEIGIDAESLEVLGALRPIHTFVSGILVTPFVGMLDTLPPLVVSEAEISRVLEVSVRDLVAAEQERELREAGGGTWRGWWYRVADATIWGATGSMLHELIELFRKEAPWAVT
jgi:8-oxo-dGTP pyrophosphatase MutT (NUDIX family)